MESMLNVFFWHQPVLLVNNCLLANGIILPSSQQTKVLTVTLMNLMMRIFFTKTEASILVKTNNIAVIKASDNYPYYLLKLTCEPYTTETNEEDDCNHTSLINHEVVKGHYMEVFKETKDGNICYLEVTKTAIISGFSVVGICPELEIFQMKRRRKMTSISLVNNDIHEALCTLVLKDV